jgi:hypothetical protein
MRIPEQADDSPIAWMAILEDTPVYSSGGEEVGVVSEVLGSEDSDIFHGVVFRHGVLRSHHMIPAESVTRITARRVDTALSADAIRALPPYREEDSYKLGFVGVIRKRLGWIRDEERP